ncbi:MAG TPA: N-6 DNA methylase [Kofleriaceae bacterium]|nr:N-6 DNA methylase [Kofleriaceae bacterium]
MDPAELDRIIADARSSPSRDPAGRAHRRLQGQVFTPARLARLVAHEVLAPFAARRGGRALVVLDPACGDGAFLAAAAEVAAALGLAVELLGVERDRSLAAACRARLPGATIHEAEVLLAAPALPAADAVVGNPPYVRSIRLKAADPALWSALRGRHAASAHGEWDLYGVFLERALGWVRPGGRVGLVTPSRWLTAAWARGLRGALAATGAVRTLVDFGAAQVFADATTYASVVVLERAAAPPVAAAAPAATLVVRDDRGWRTHAFDPSAEGPWVATLSGAPDSAPALRLGDVARIAKGTGTNADPVFVLVDAVVDGDLVHARGPDGAPVVVEREATRPCWRGRDIQHDAAAPRARCLVPYDAAGLIPWPALEARWPRAAAYLLAHRARLEAREQGRFAGERFHCFGRPQNLAFLLDRAAKVIVPDVCRAPRAVLDTEGALVLDTAYALRPRPGAPPPWDDIASLHALLRSPAVPAWLARAGAPLRGDYRRWKTAYLAPMPLPMPLPLPAT